MSTYVNIINQRFGNLTVKRLHHTKKYPSGQIVEFYLCECDCGNETIVSKRNLKTNHTRSCGCLKNIAYNYSHKMNHTRIYGIWCDIKVRCYNKNCNRYKYYGGKGIKMCIEWKNNFQTFYNWAQENGYNDTLSIDRIDVNADYTPNNCRWSNAKTQARNTTRNKYITYQNETHCIAEWAEIYGMKYSILWKKLNRGLTFSEAVKLQ